MYASGLQHIFHCANMSIDVSIRSNTVFTILNSQYCELSRRDAHANFYHLKYARSHLTAIVRLYARMSRMNVRLIQYP